MKIIFLMIAVLWITTSVISFVDIFRRKRVNPLWLWVLILCPVFGPLIYASSVNYNARRRKFR
jgi:hypothetical protein